MTQRRGRARGVDGFTLIEIVISTLVLAVGVVALLSAFLSGLLLVESGRNMAVAAADARSVLEEMRQLSAGGLAPVTARNWATWSRGAGLTGLTNEAIAVRFLNPAADPLQATVTVTWTERTRNRSANVMGLVTRR